MLKKLRCLEIALLGILVLLCMSSVVLADNKYSIPKAEFEVTINEDGSASVHEKWTVEFIRGSFSRFYKDLSTYVLPADEEFSAVSDVSVFIDGKECEYTDDVGGRPDFHFNISSARPGASLAAYARSSDVTRTYDFYYTLKDVVKSVNDQYYLFIYRFIGANFSKDVGSVKVQLTAPDGAACKVLYTSAGSSKVNGNVVNTKCSVSSGMYKLRVRMDGVKIPGAKKIRSSDLSNRVETKEKITRYLPKILLWLAIFYILYKLIRNGIRNRKALKMLENEGMKPIYNAIAALSDNLDPTELAGELVTDKWIFPLHLAYMVSQGKILKKTDKDNQLILCLPEKIERLGASEADQYVYDVVEYSRGNQKTEISIKDLNEWVNETADEAYNVNNTLRTHLHNQVVNKVEHDQKEYKKKKKWLLVCLNVAKKHNMLPEISSRDLFENYVSHFYAICYQMNNAFPIADNNEIDEYYYWDSFQSETEISHASYIQSHASDSSSGGGGCSSCSSCSSCGGGGAD